MKYIDMHCDTLTVCRDGGHGLSDCPLQINLERLEKAGCAAQCFAVFTDGDGAAEKFYAYLDYFNAANLNRVESTAELERCVAGNGTGAVLTVENLGFVSDLSELSALKSAGVKMASLVWNNENKFAYPNLIFSGGVPQFAMREPRGLKPLGRQAVEELDRLKIIVDISHLSDGGAEEILAGRKIPIVASHSCAADVCNVSRNLNGPLIKKIADCGGIVGVNFCKDFLGDGDTFELVLKHILAVMKAGGEEAVAFGSDFDGIPAPPRLETCEKMPALIEYLSGRFPARVLEKLCYKNFCRVFKEVCG